LDKLVGH